ncbi:beta-galactosidase [Streptomyces sp. NPDC057781]|uniref:beta-galactosidase n=1 Tax=unclassified Streptomyces TaxID=2593676 RepID=UPI0036CFBF89
MTLAYGGDYNPEQWDPALWREDVALMREAGVTSVTVGVFSWARLQPDPDRWDFDWLDEALELLHGAGIGVCLATATASPPPWLARLRPDSLPRRADGSVLWPGARQHYCPSSPAYREAALRLTEAMAQRYGNHPALRSWHINNEYGCHLAECFCDVSAAHFRTWLRDRYGDLDGLNSAWSTSLWSQRYGDWAEVLPPRTAPYFPNPAQQLDWRRFSSDALLKCHNAERAVLRRRTPNVPTTTNFFGITDALDLWRWAPHQDVVSFDSYPDPVDPEAAVDAAFHYDLMRSLGGGRPWTLMEQAPGRINWRHRNVPKRPGLMRLWSLQAVARGADAVNFFQWRSSRGGAEKYHEGMLPHGGTDTRVWREVRALGAELAGLAAVAGSRVAADAAVVLDVESWWALETDSHPSCDIRLLDQVRRHYRPLWEVGVTTDVVHPDHDLSAYRLVVVPNLVLMREETAARLADYVHGGGHLVVSFFSGIVDDCDRIHAGGYAAPARDWLGVRIEEFWPLADGDMATLEPGKDTAEGVPGGTADLWCDTLHPEPGAEVLLSYVDGPLSGRPAVTRHRYGQGTVTYLGTRPDRTTMDRLVRDAADAAGATRTMPGLPPGVEAVCRGDTLFLLNHRATPVTVPLPGPATAHVDLAPLDVRVVRGHRPDTAAPA